MLDLKANPFFLSDQDIDWVNNTLAGMTLPEKVGQLFCPVGVTSDEKVLAQLAGQMGIGGIMYRPGHSAEVQKAHRILQQYAKIPLLLAANLEGGGNGVALDGTAYAKPLQAAAANDDEAGYKLGKVACSEGAAVGCNWAFAPIVDIDINFRNPITNLRTFGSDANRVLKMAKGYLRAADEEGLAVSIKHFPGDGVDERDQHLLTSVNSLTVQQWDDSFGKVYGGLIEAGAKTVMVGHIAQPAYAHALNPKLPEQQVVPATLSPELLGGLLRGKLGFNGLVITDASPMVGFCAAMKRADAVPYTIAAGCDMLLFNKDIAEDFGYMMAGVQSGVITPKRLDEAVTRILALKASLKLHEKKANGTLVPGEEALARLRNPRHVQWAKECADASVTLVKDTQQLLPLSAAKTPRLYLNVLEENDKIDSPLRTLLKSKLEAEGFAVTVRNRDMQVDMAAMMRGEPDPRTMEVMQEAMGGTNSFVEQYDIVLYVANMETASNNTVVRLDWKGLGGMGNDTPWFVKELPVLFVSLANPYHLLDVPMIQTYINAYSAEPDTVDALMEKLMGRSEFTGTSPVDAFCGRWDTAL